MKKISSFLIILVWVTLIYILFKLDLFNIDMNKLNIFFDSHRAYEVLIFIAMSSLRIIALVPSSVFMVLGGILFKPMEGFVLTLVSVAVSETIVYIVSKILIGSKLQSYLVEKYPKVYKLLCKNNIKILTLGIICPIAPSDVMCFFAGSAGLNYKKFILVVIVANIPMMLLYSFLGNSIANLAGNAIIIAAFIVMMSTYSVHLWNKEKRV